MADTVDPVLLEQIKTILRRDLKLGLTTPIADDMPLVGGEMDLDSLDILLLVSSIEKQFGFKIPSEAVGRWVFQNVATIAKYVQDNHEVLKTPGFVPAGVAAPIDWLARLPHGPEFRYVSRVDEVVPGQSARGAWVVSGAEAFFKGHFPGRPIVPGVLLVEAMAQMAGLAAPIEGAKSGMVVQFDVRFDQPVVPPAEITLTATVTRSMGQLVQCDVAASAANVVAARGSVTLHLE